ncbi:helix-turn-helix domain-containing protein [Rhodococcus wratislaviensis]|uniref:helix-turn-helix domain-containing protein n=1 Tax=Rhodococcus wratislaviensis TaxID=44752 RepID=UPI00365DC44D
MTTYLSTRQVAEITGFCEETIRRHAVKYAQTKKSKQPKGLKGTQPNGRDWRFKPEDVHKFMDGT